MEEICISVIIPMFNSSDTILNCIHSVENQTRVEYIKEIIVVDDGSTDISADLVDSYIGKCKIKLNLIKKENGGVSTARNVGMKSAKGNWIAFLDSDDEWYENKIEVQLSIISNKKNIDFLSVNFDEKETKVLFKKINQLHKVDIKELCLKNLSQPSTVIMKRKIFEEIGGFDEKQRYAEDGNYFLKICYQFQYYHLPKQLITYGSGKRGFGVSGLSANLKEMYLGNLKNIKELKEKKWISKTYYSFLLLFYSLKYYRRIIITKLK